MKISLIVSVICILNAIVEMECIRGGNTAELGDFPYVVSCKHKGSNAKFCSGVILSHRYILTSESCAQEDIKEVIVGTVQSTDEGDNIHIGKVIRHPKRGNNMFKNNLALFRTDEEIEFSDNIRSANLLSSDVSDTTYLNAIGWDEDGQGNLTYLELRTINRDFCRAKLQNSNISSNHICTNNRFGEGLCEFADNGSPLVDRDGYLVGIANVVQGSDECASGYPDVYMRVWAFKDWIEEVIATDGSNCHNASMTAKFIVLEFLIIISNLYFQ